jgi:hypothetical protein
LKLDTTSNAIEFYFTALEKDDGFFAQIIYDGKIDTPIELRGGIDGVKKLADGQTFKFEPRYSLPYLRDTFNKRE